jgi:hypothetical protein
MSISKSKYRPCSASDKWRVSARYASVQSGMAGKSAISFKQAELAIRG